MAPSLWTRIRAARRQRWVPPVVAQRSTYRFEYDHGTPAQKPRRHRPLTPAQVQVAERLYHHGSKVRFRCELDHSQTCADRNTLRPIGTSVHDGFTQRLYQCPSCHAVWTEDEAFR